MPNNNEIEVRSEEVQEILSYVPHWMIRWGNTLFFILIIMLLFISWFIKYPDVINAEVIVTTQIPPQKEFARVSGKIDTFFIENNENVIKNQPLALIENTANYTDVFLLKSIIDTINIQKETFNFPIDDLPILFLGDIENSFELFENNYFKIHIKQRVKPLFL